MSRNVARNAAGGGLGGGTERVHDDDRGRAWVDEKERERGRCCRVERDTLANRANQI